MNETLTVKVLHLLGALRPSGMERMLVTAAKHFQQENITSVIVGQGQNHSFTNELVAAGYDVLAMDSVGSSISNARAFRRLVRELDVDIVHVHTEGNYLRTVLAAKWALGRRGAIVRTVHSVFDASGFWRFSRLLQAVLADRLVGALIAPSPDVAANERRIFRKTQVVFNWVDDSVFGIRRKRTDDQNDDKKPTALIVGNCSKIKQHEIPLEAILQSNHKLIHLGDEQDASARELALLSSLDSSGLMDMRGVQPPHEALCRADYFVMSSSHEGMSVALAEAIVAGLPALVNDVKGLQWAKGIPGVSMVANEQSSWAAAIDGWKKETGGGNCTAPDLSAIRGAREYADIYRVLARSKDSYPST